MDYGHSPPSDRLTGHWQNAVVSVLQYYKCFSMINWPDHSVGNALQNKASITWCTISGASRREVHVDRTA